MTTDFRDFCGTGILYDRQWSMRATITSFSSKETTASPLSLAKTWIEMPSSLEIVRRPTPPSGSAFFASRH